MSRANSYSSNSGERFPLTAPLRRAMTGPEYNKNAQWIHRSFRDQLAFSIGFAVTRSRDLLRRILKEHRRTMPVGSSQSDC